MRVDAAAALDAVRLAAASGQHHVALLDVDAESAALLRFATQVGAPVGLACDLCQRRLTDRIDVVRAIRVASAEARSVAGFLLLAPVVLLPLVATMLAVPVWPFFTRPFGQGVLAVAAAAYLVGFRVIHRMTRLLDAPVLLGRNRSGNWHVAAAVLVWVATSRWYAGVAAGLLLHVLSKRHDRAGVTLGALAFAADVSVVGIAAGMSVPVALRNASRQVPSVAAELRQLAFTLDGGVAPVPAAGPFGRLGDIAWRAHHDGAPAVPVMLQFAGQLRADERSELLARTARLPARLTVPTTLLFLPATVLVMVAPVLAHGVSMVAF